MAVNDRFAWAIDTLHIRPSDMVLEIGCGTGILVAMIAERLTSGCITAIDQSRTMIDKAYRKNQQLINEGKVRLVAGKFSDNLLHKERFNKIIAFNVSVFWKDPVKELSVIKSHLTKDGQFFLFHQPPVEKTKQVAELAKEQLFKNKFHIERTTIKLLHPVSAFCIIARPT
jgi:tRNA A58 N-methylase Trm61